jgi:hypothetical protein
MPPCHGGDRRFKSGRARQETRSIQKMGLFSCPGPTRIRTGEERGFLPSGPGRATAEK